MNYPLGKTLYFDVILASPTSGGVSDADSLPTFEVFEDATDTDIGIGTTMTKRTGKTGNYRGSFVMSGANGFEVGRCYSVIVTAVVSGVTVKIVAKDFGVDPFDTATMAGITDYGTAGSASAGSLTLETGHVFPTDLLNGSEVFVKGSTQGYWQAAQIISNTNANPCVATIADNFAVTPSGTISYFIFGATPASAAHPPQVALTIGTITSVAAAVRDVDNTAPAASSLGAKVNNAASAGDPWATVLPASYAANTAGARITALNTAIPVPAAGAAGGLPIVGSAMTLTSGERDAIADAQFDRVDAIEVGMTLRQALRITLAESAGATSGAGTGTMLFRNAVANSKTRITATLDGAGNRIAVVYDKT